MNPERKRVPCEKLALVWSVRREQVLALRVEYEVVQIQQCTVYRLNRLEELAETV